MLFHYQSDFPNQVHQLNISLSQHHYLLSDGKIKWQKKKLDISWENFKRTNKRHLVTFIIRDHYSNCFYAEFHPIDKIPAIQEFLFNAWRKKELYEFRGVPNVLITPQVTLKQFPNLVNFFKNVTIVKLQNPTSGFTSAIRSIRDWERYMKYYTVWDKYTYSEISEINEIINKEINTRETEKSEINLKKWIENNPKIINPGDKERFFSFFN